MGRITLKYITVTAENTEDEFKLFTDMLGFEFKGTITLTPDIPCSLFYHRTDGAYIALMPECNARNNIMILNTSDCLSSYHELRRKGIRFLYAPNYVWLGWVAEFEDETGNRFVLLEECENRPAMN